MARANSIIRLFILSAMCLLLSCDSFFDVEQSNIIKTKDVWRDPQKVEALLADLYAKTQYEDFSYFEGFWVFTQINLTTASDEAFPSWQVGDFGNSNVAQAQYGDDWFYMWPYDHINNCNKFIEKLKESSLDDGLKRQLECEVRFLRAYQYFHLVKRFGGVPIMLVSTTNIPDNGGVRHKARDKEEEVWEFIFSELDIVDKILPEKREPKYRNRVTKYAAMALKSRAMLYAGSISKYGQVQLDGIVGVSKDDKIYWQRSYDASVEIIKDAKYDLYNEYSDPAENYRQLFLDKDNREYIWTKEYSYPNLTHDFDKYATPYSFVGGYGCGPNPTLELVESYEYIDGTSGELLLNDGRGELITYNNPLDLFKNKDPRLFASIYLPNSPCRDDIVEVRRGIYYANDKRFEKAFDFYSTVTMASGTKMYMMGKDGMIDYDDVTKSGFYQRKFLNEKLLNVDFGRSDQSWPLFRLAEIYLNLAEAAFMLNKSDESLIALNKIRKRAGIRELNASELSLDRIRHERRIELAFEHHRFWDLRRWRIAANRGVVKGVLYEWQPTALYPWVVYENEKYVFTRASEEIPKPKKMFYERNYYLKIRSGEMTSNTQFVQNPGY